MDIKVTGTKPIDECPAEILLNDISPAIQLHFPDEMDRLREIIDKFNHGRGTFELQLEAMDIVSLINDLHIMNESDTSQDECCERYISDCDFEVGSREWWDYAESLEIVTSKKDIFAMSLRKIREV